MHRSGRRFDGPVPQHGAQRAGHAAGWAGALRSAPLLTPCVALPPGGSGNGGGERCGAPSPAASGRMMGDDATEPRGVSGGGVPAPRSACHPRAPSAARRACGAVRCGARRGGVSGRGRRCRPGGLGGPRPRRRRRRRASGAGRAPGLTGGPLPDGGREGGRVASVPRRAPAPGSRAGQAGPASGAGFERRAERRERGAGRGAGAGAGRTGRELEVKERVVVGGTYGVRDAACPISTG